MNRFFNQHHNWLSPVLMVINTITASLWVYDLPQNYNVSHPIKHAIYTPILEWSGVIFLISLSLFGILTFFDNRNRKTIDQLSKENKQFKQLSNTIHENIKELFNGFLYQVSSLKLNFEPSERITLYIHNGDNKFIPFGRSSLNPQFAKKGRPQYPDDQGCISKGWEKKWFFFTCIEDPDTALTKYSAEQKDNFNVDKNTVRKLKMKSRLFAVLRLDLGSEKIAVIVVESTNPNKYIEEDIKKKLEEQHDYLSDMITTLKRYIPKQSKAAKIEDI